jgi:uncharacterized protein YecT (DUF1311 family)
MKKIVMLVLFTALVFGYDPSGSYQYQEKGYSGKMDIIPISRYQKTYKAVIETLNAQTTHTCVLTVNGRIQGDTPNSASGQFTFKNGDNAKFLVAFIVNTAYIKIFEQSDHCGLTGYFGGEWKKVSSADFDTTSEKLSDSEYVTLKLMSAAYATADGELNTAFRALKNTLTSEGKEQLKNDQKNWIQIRDQKLIASSKKGSQAYITKLIQLTRERTGYLSSLKH